MSHYPGPYVKGILKNKVHFTLITPKVCKIYYEVWLKQTCVALSKSVLVYEQSSTTLQRKKLNRQIDIVLLSILKLCKKIVKCCQK